MKLKKLKFEGFYLFNYHVFKDDRGFFRRHFCKKDFFKKNIFHKWLKDMTLIYIIDVKNEKKMRMKINTNK